MTNHEQVSLFIERDVKCPACREVSTQRAFRRNVFEPHKVEDDQHVVEYRWLVDTATRVHPPFYFVQYCPNCSYASLAEDFENPFDTETATQALRGFKRATEFQRIVIDMLANAITYDNIQFDSALYLHLLALHQQRLAPESARDDYKIGRLALRIAWLYREQESGPEQETADEGSRDDWTPGQRALKNALGPVQEAIGAVARVWPDLEKALQQRSAEIAPEVGEEREDPYVNPTSAFPREVHALTALVRELDATVSRDLATGLFVEAAPSGGGASMAAVRTFLERVRDYWPDVPLAERAATAQAIDHFQKALENDPRLSAHDAYAPVGLLVARLQKRLSDYGGAMEMVRKVHKHAVESRQEYDEMLQDPRLSGARISQIQSKLKRTASSVEEANELRETLVRLMIKRDAPKIKAVLQRTAGASVEDIQKTLLANDIAPEVVSRLKRAGGPLAATK